MDLKKTLINVFKDKPVVLVGAGISFNSGIPTVFPLKASILRGMNILNESEIEEISSFEIPFESFISSLLSDCSSITKLFDIYSLGKPNLNHFLLAHLSKIGFLKIIITTNFDTLIEQAFHKIGNSELKVLYTQKQIKNIDYNYNGTILIKIHGCVTSKRTIATTLNRVSGINSYDYRKKLITKIFCDNKTDVVSMGYSYSDAFDISPAIEKCKNKDKNVYILGHNPSSHEILDVKSLKKIHPLRLFKNTKKIATHFDKLINEVWSELFKNIDKDNFNKKFNDKYKLDLNNKVFSIIDDWINEVVNDFSESALYSMVAGIYIKASKYAKAEEYIRKAISYSYNIDNKENVLHYSLGLSMLYDNRGYYDKVIEISTKNIELIDSSFKENKIYEDGLLFYKMNFLRYLGKAYQNQTQYLKSYNITDQALAYSKDLKNKNNEVFLMTIQATNLFNLGKFKEAKEMFINADKIYWQRGDITGVSFNYSEFAKLYIEKSNFEEAIKLLEKSLSISKKIDNKANIAIDTSELAYLYLLKNDYTKSKKYFDDAFNQYSELEDILGEAICLNNYAHYLYKTGNLENAIKKHKEAIIVLLKFNYLPSLKTAYQNLNTIYLDLNNLSEAEEYSKLLKKLD